jgi:hypothetical protein
MTAEEFATDLGRLIAQARAGGDLTDEAIIAGLEEAIEAIEEDMKPWSSPSTTSTQGQNEAQRTVQEFADRLELLIADARLGDLSVETIIVKLASAAEALEGSTP